MPTWFNPRYRGIYTLQECLQRFDEADADPPPASQDPPLHYGQLYTWQKAVVSLIDTPENPNFGRTIFWVWEAEGNVGKSVLVKYLLQHYRAVQVRGATSNALHVIAAYKETSGNGPHLVIVDLPRSADEVNYELLEEVKNGCFMSGKYEGTHVTFPRPHVLVFANRTPDDADGKLSKDRLKVFHINDLPLDQRDEELEQPQHKKHKSNQEAASESLPPPPNQNFTILPQRYEENFEHSDFEDDSEFFENSQSSSNDTDVEFLSFE